MAYILPLPKSHILTSPYLSGAVSQSCLRCVTQAAVLILPPVKLNSQLSLVPLFLVESSQINFLPTRREGFNFYKKRQRWGEQG